MSAQYMGSCGPVTDKRQVLSSAMSTLLDQMEEAVTRWPEFCPGSWLCQQEAAQVQARRLAS